jgi:uncharacterized repeat protein (TIGR03987 family)
MPVNIVIGLVALLFALVMYSIGAWGAFRAKGITRRHTVFLWVGFAFDVLATAMMAIQAGGLDLSPLSDLLHTVLALLAMFGMLAAAIVGTSAVANKDDSLRSAVARWVLAPWTLWIVVFVWGMVSRGSQRLG